MACQRVPTMLQAAPWRRKSYQCVQCLYTTRRASTFNGMTELSEDVVPDSSLQVPGPSEEHIQRFNPIARSKRRRSQLPPSRSVIALYLQHQPLTNIFSATNSALPATTAVPSTHTNHLLPPPPPPASSSPVPSPSPASNKPTTAL